jgi:acetyl esterase
MPVTIHHPGQVATIARVESSMPIEFDEQQTDDVEPGVRAFQKQVIADYDRLSTSPVVDVVERRQIAEKVREPWARGGPQMGETINLRVRPGDVPVRLHRPIADPTLPVMIYVHGGGWVLFSVDTHDRLMREYSARSGITVIGVDYSLAPEAQFPTQIHEILSVVSWVRSSDSDQWIRPNKIAIGGDSAGANLAITTNIALRDAQEPVLDAMLLNYGAFDTQPRGSHERYGGQDYMLTPEEMNDFWANYLPASARDNPLARPMLGDLRGLPPAYLCIAECDILADENWEMARRLREVDVPVVAKGYAGATHSFLEAVSLSSIADQALEDASLWLKGVLGK